MKTKTKIFSRWALLLALLLTATLLFSACNTSTAEKVQESSDDPQNEVLLPVTGSEPEPATDIVAEPEEIVAYPDSEQEIQNSENTGASQGEAYPDPIETAVATEKPAPTAEAEPTLGPQPTSRGNELVATDPATVSLASGKIQLVEMFAFW